MENWIKVRYKGTEVEFLVKQESRYSDIFVDKEGGRFSVRDLDFNNADNGGIIGEIVKNQSRIEEQQRDLQKGIEKLSDSVSLNATISDRNILAVEREFWRKLRADIFMKAMKKYDISKMGDVDSALNRTKYIFNQLHQQDIDFFFDKIVMSVPVK